MATVSQLVPISETLDRRLSIDQIKARRSAIRSLMKETMRDGVDYGVIPGTTKQGQKPKPTLLKPGAEKLCALFQLAPRITVTDYSTEGVMRYQVKVELYTSSGVFVGEGMGSASSNETKYQWRAALCKEEFEATPEDRRRIQYKRSGNSTYTVAQIRTEEADQDNTVLKMAKKRGLVDAVLTVTAASDIFSQDQDENEDEPADEGDESNGEETTTTPPQRQAPPPTKPPAAKQPVGQVATAPTITQPQQGRFYAIAKKAGKGDDEIHEYLFARFRIEHSRDLRRDQYDEACLWAAGIQPKDEEEDPAPEDREIF